MPKILLVDDDPLVRDGMKETLSRKGFDVISAANGVDALARLGESSFSLIISDVRMPEMDGKELLRRIKEEAPQTPVLMMTAYQDTSDAVELMKLGAHDYLFKPVEGSVILGKIREILPEPGERPSGFDEIVTTDPPMLKLLEMLDMVGQSNASVLLSGESGTGKEVFARAIHTRSPRSKKGEFVAVNCAALPEDLLESELFGHEKGSFTGATGTRKGKFELAHQGTILLDEISEMPVVLQAKLLRAIQEQEIDRVGGSRPVKVDVRIIATTNRDLKEHIANQQFREDLYYRLCVVPLTLPPLRDRRGDIPLLARRFLREFAEQNNKSASDFTDTAVRWLESQPWPGNVRQLRNLIERAVVFAQRSRLDVRDLTLDLMSPVETETPEPGPVVTDSTHVDVRVGMTASEAEKRLILRTLEECDGNKTRAAEVLGITTRTIRNKLREYGLMGDANGDS